MKSLLSAALAGLLLVSPAFADQPVPTEKPRIDVVFCVDCSGSMGPVIDAAKQKVWAIVNQVARAEPAPILRIGLIGYGDGANRHRVFPLSDDLDDVYKNLSTFKDEGWSAEFVGLAIHKATGEMKWSDGTQVLKVIYVVGNETAHQGPAEMDYTKTAPAAIAQGIQVNAIYCGSEDYAQATPTWREITKLADGRYMEINASGGAIAIATPFDDELGKLNARLNGTYLAYGAKGGAGAANQLAQDSTALSLAPASAADRYAAKSSKQYRNSKWDLVDALAEKEVDLAKLTENELPDELKKLKPEERKAYVDAKAKERAEVQKEIQEVAKKREAYIQAETKKANLSDSDAFDAAVRTTITEQAEKKGFKFEK